MLQHKQVKNVRQAERFFTPTYVRNGVTSRASSSNRTPEPLSKGPALTVSSVCIFGSK